MTKKAPKIKVAPNSKESEMMVLGSMLTNFNSLNLAAESLSEKDFYYTEHQTIFEALKNAFMSDKPADIHLISEELKRIDKLDSIGGIAYLTTLAQYAGTSAYIEEYTELIKNKSILRRMISASQDIEKTALEEPSDVARALDEAQGRFFSISQSTNRSAGIMLKDILSGVKSESNLPFLKELQERQEEYLEKGDEDLGLTGMPTHFTDLDKMLNGLGNSNLYILAARPAMGKTALAINIAEMVCFKNEAPVGIFSLEMSAEQLIHRMICSQSEVESGKIQSGSISGVEYQRIVGSVKNMQDHTMIIDDQPGLKISDLRARARRMKEASDIQLLIIDYLQLISGSGGIGGDSRQNEISEISRGLKNLARELNIPIICLSQLSRRVEERTGHRPMLSDLRESGCLTGDTLIKDADTGKLIPIKTLAERKIQEPIPVYGVDDRFQIGRHKLVKAFYSGDKPVFELKTKGGRTIKASGNHPFLTLGGWKALDKLKVGDRVGSNQTQQISHSTFSYSSFASGSLVKERCKAALHLKTDVFPKEIWSLFIEPARKKQGLSSFSLKQEISRNILSKMNETLQDPNLRNLIRSEVYWDEIVSITSLGVEPVYDATIENVHNFLANDFYVHNSIEQDSDVVMFLLRREYYDPYDKPGLAELIVAKNRHGGVGSVNLTFRKEIAQFANYTEIQKTESNEEDNNEAFSAFSPN